PDDEILGCGATMARHISEGDKVHVHILAEGITSRDQERNKDLREKELSGLKTSAINANKILGIKSVFFHNFPDNRMDGIELLDVIKVIEKIIKETGPDIIYTHYINDLNIDHQVISKAVVTATRPLPGIKIPTILFFEIPSSTEWQTSLLEVFSPNWFVDISGYLELKLRALKAYEGELRSWPHPRSLKGIEYLAKVRGATVGLEASEAFMLSRKVEGIVNERI
ncbi:MAG: PIG-L family deacetylase, partial [Proteobacteria bacterium]|nr:PIG-L family deacetylase [Pseudomonadota bacterium]